MTVESGYANKTIERKVLFKGKSKLMSKTGTPLLEQYPPAKKFEGHPPNVPDQQIIQYVVKMTTFVVRYAS